MPRTAPVMTRISPKTKEKLRALASSTDRSEAYLVSEAIENYVAENEWQVALIRERVAEAEAGGKIISHDEAMRRLADKVNRSAVARSNPKRRRTKA